MTNRNVMRTSISDPVSKEKVNITSNALDVCLQDQSSEIIDLYMCSEIGTTTPSVAMSLDDKTVTVVSATGAAVGDCINIVENGRVFQAVVQSIVGLVITFNAPSDQAFTIDAVVIFGEWNMNYDGSTTSLIYKVCPPAGVKWDVTRCIFGMEDNVVMDDAKFGGIASLTNGVVLRIKDGYSKNIFIVQNNGGFRERSFDIAYADKAPAGTYGFGCRRTFAGQDKNGVTIRLDGDTGDELQMIIQDDLTGLEKLACVVQGHVVE